MDGFTYMSLKWDYQKAWWISNFSTPTPIFVWFDFATLMAASTLSMIKNVRLERPNSSSSSCLPIVQIRFWSLTSRSSLERNGFCVLSKVNLKCKIRSDVKSNAVLTLRILEVYDWLVKMYLWWRNDLVGSFRKDIYRNNLRYFHLG